MEDDSLLDDPTILARETPPQANVTPGSFSIKLISRLGLNRIQRSETVYNNNKSTDVNDEDNIPSTSGVVSTSPAIQAIIDKELTDPLRRALKCKCQASAKCEFLRTCMAKDTMPKGITINVPLKVTDAPTDLQQQWNSILTSCSKQLMLTLIKFHQGKVQQHEHLAETIINDATHMIIPEYITTVPNNAQLIESRIDDLLCEMSLLDRKLRKRPTPSTANKKPKAKKQKVSDPVAAVTSLEVDNPKNGVSSKGKDVPKHPWRPLKLKKNIKK